MQAVHAAKAADRISHAAVMVAGALCGVLVFFVAAPLALSSPFPSLKEETWIIDRPVSQQAAISVPAVIAPPTVLVPEAPETPRSSGSVPPSGAASSFVPVETDEPQSTGTISLASATSTPVDLGERAAPAK